MFKQFRFLIAFIISFVGISTKAATVLSYDFTSDANPSFFATGVDGTSLSAGTGTSLSISTNSLSVSGWDSGTFNNADSFTFSILAREGYNVAIDGISFDTKAGKGNQNVKIEFSTDGVFWTEALTIGNISKDWKHHDVLLSINSPVTLFRFYGTSNKSDPFSFDNITITGNTTAIPSPNTLALLFCLVIGLKIRSGGIKWMTSL